MIKDLGTPSISKLKLPCILWISLTGDAITAESYFRTHERISQAIHCRVLGCCDYVPSFCMIMSGLIQLLWLVTGYGTMAGSLWTTLPTAPIWCPMISVRLDPEAPDWQTVFNRCWYEANFRNLATSIGPTVWQMLSVWYGPSCGVCYLIFGTPL